MDAPRERSCAGFVLAGGRSSRMGRDKALLPVGDVTLVEQVAGRVGEAAGNVTLIGPPERYAHLGFPMIGDLVEGCGPLGGILTALRATAAEWNLVVACDMPAITAEFLREILDAAETCGRAAVVPLTGAGWEPLCAVYHRRLLPAVESAIHNKSFKMHDFIAMIEPLPWPAADASLFENINTPEQVKR